MAQRFKTPITVEDATSAASQAISVDVNGDTQKRLTIDAGGKVSWGDGTNAPDTTLYRSAANTLKTDDALEAASLGVSGDITSNGTIYGQGGFVQVSASSASEGGEIRLDGGTSYSGVYARIDRYLNTDLRFMDGYAVKMSLNLSTADLTVNGNVIYTQTMDTKTASYTVVSSDNGKLLYMENGASDLTVTVDSSTGFSVGQRVDILRTGTGSVTVVQGSGATVYYTPALTLRAQNSAATLVCTGSNQYHLIGDLG